MTGIVRLELPPKGPTALSRQPLPPGTILPVQMVQSDLQGTPDNIRRVTTKLRAPWSSSSSSSSPSSVTPRNENNLHQQGEVEDKHEQEGAYLVALGSERKAPFNLPQFLAPYPTLRMLASLLSLEATTALIPKVCFACALSSTSVCFPRTLYLFLILSVDRLVTLTSMEENSFNQLCHRSLFP
jgi:hypothetical protein